MAAIALEHLEKRYRAVCALADFSLEVADGELVVIVGPSGCGKTTLLRLIAGLEIPTRGEVLVGGRPMRGVPPRDRNVALVFQDFALYPNRSVGENLAFPLAMRGIARGDRAAEIRDIARLLEIEDLLERRPMQLSAGQQQRVALGRALVRRPACLLLDEPLAHLDPGLRRQMRAELKRLQAERATTTVYVTHDQEEALALGRRVVVMRQGRIEQVGTPEEVFRRPVNRYVAQFFGTPAMNLLPARLGHGEGQWWLEIAGQHLQWDGDREDLPPGPEVLIGIRPEDLGQHPRGERDAFALHGMVEWTESLGSVTDVQIRLADGLRLLARLEGGLAFPAGATLRLYPALDRIHIFPQ